MFVRQETNASYGFKAPNSVVDTDKKVEVLFPSVDTQSPDYAATINLTVDQLNTIVEVGALTGNPTINVAVDDEVTKNAEMLLKLTASGGARTVTLGTGFSGSAIVVPSGATVYALLKYDGTNFVVVTSTNDDVQDGAITAAKLATDAVETAKIKNDAVTSDKIADDAITADHLPQFRSQCVFANHRTSVTKPKPKTRSHAGAGRRCDRATQAADSPWPLHGGGRYGSRQRKDRPAQRGVDWAHQERSRR